MSCSSAAWLLALAAFPPAPAPQAEAAAQAARRRADAERSWSGFPAFVWRQTHFGKEAPEELLAGLGGTNVERHRDEAWVLERGLDFYVGHGPGRDVLHLDKDRDPWAKQWSSWLEDRDHTHLVRRPCLTDPAVAAELRAALQATLAARGNRHGVGVSLGDEVSLTPFGDPFDLCFSPTCARAWSEWSGRELEGDVDVGVLTDTVRLAVTSGETAGVGPWLEKREFHRDIVVQRLEELAALVRAESPGTGVGLLGMAGATAFGGVPVERVAGLLDFVECYPVGDARELFATVRAPHQRTLATVFPELAPVEGVAWQVWSHWLRGGDGIVVWSDRLLAREKLFAERVRQALVDVRAANRLLPDFAPRPAGAAVVHCTRSASAAWLKDALLDGPTWPNRFAGFQDNNGTRERALSTWLRLFEDIGLLPGAVTLDSVGPATAARFPLLVLNWQLVVDPADLERLAAFAEAGGRLVVHGEFGWIDSSGARLEDEPGTALEEAAGQAPLTAPSGFDRYLNNRKDPDSESAAFVRQTARKWFQTKTSQRAFPPWRPTGAAETVPWLCATQFDPANRDLICAALPNWPKGPARRKRLRDLRFEIEVPLTRRVVWIHPPAGIEGETAVDLPAGDAAVFRLVLRKRFGR